MRAAPCVSARIGTVMRRLSTSAARMAQPSSAASSSAERRIEL
jgi:hypothetical protein